MKIEWNNQINLKSQFDEKQSIFDALFSNEWACQVLFEEEEKL